MIEGEWVGLAHGLNQEKKGKKKEKESFGLKKNKKEKDDGRGKK